MDTRKLAEDDAFLVYQVHDSQSLASFLIHFTTDAEIIVLLFFLNVTSVGG